MEPLTGIVLFLIAAVGLRSLLWHGLPSPFNTRVCQGKEWRHAFPCASSRDIREFLADFAAAFAFPKRTGLNFNPEDRILRIYRARYSSPWMPDALELESLDLTMQAKYGLSLVRVWHENITLGELFGKTHKGCT